MQRLFKSLRQSMNKQLPIHDKTFNKHFLQTLLLRIRVNKRIFIIQLIPMINRNLIYTQKHKNQ